MESSEAKLNLLKIVITATFLGLAAITLTGWISAPLALATGIIFALLMGNPIPGTSHRASQILLQWSVVGLGFGMNLPAVWAAGKMGVWFTMTTVFGVLFLGMFLGRRMKIESQTSTLIAAGTSICGGSAIAAVGSVIEANATAMSVSLCTVFVLNAVALFIFPPIGHFLGFDQTQFGIWSAIAIQDTSSVVGAASKYGEQALGIATTVKLTRALWIIPITLGISLAKHRQASKVKIPWFIIAFIGAAGIRTLWPQAEGTYDMIKHAAKLGLNLTLFLIGTGLTKDAIKTAGFRPMLLGIFLWISVSTVGILEVQYLLH